MVWLPLTLTAALFHPTAAFFTENGCALRGKYLSSPMVITVLCYRPTADGHSPTGRRAHGHRPAGTRPTAVGYRHSTIHTGEKARNGRSKAKLWKYES